MAERKIRTRAVVRADARCADHCERVCLFELVGIERWRDGGTLGDFWEVFIPELLWFLT